jgi:AcrR family transcriptional regulator
MPTVTDSVVTPPAPRRPRADAERNRLGLLDAAIEVFAEGGLDATVAEVAKRAGVGQGTAFRHYPTKEALVVACVGQSMDRLASIAVALQQEPDPLQALREFMRAGAELQSANRGLCEAMGGTDVLADPSIRARHEHLLDASGRLLRRAQEAGVVRADVMPEDLPLLVCAIGYAAMPLHADAPGLWLRYFELVFDALRPDGASELSQPAPSRAQLESLKGLGAPPG